MRVRGNLCAQGLVALLFPPDPGVRQEEPLLPRQAVNRSGFGSRKRNLQGLEGDSCPAEVADIFADGQGPVDVRAVWL